ncbi:hypothetical protein DAEQUDRAFT_758670 [Daedalea quercina L-15889]|uniref:Uncharacterized protein n=1 Tax=Daedalea quercina L-15889 TaxID=1314783 RepID=A0A165N5R0_9APHY|nr:hypothetical protein DAEQUDRAFT_758670 [Daedalea quercina L-15889]
MSLAGLRPWPQHATREARQLVLSILRSQKEPVAAKDLYKLVVESEVQKSDMPAANPDQTVFPSSGNRPMPPHPQHTIRSMRYFRGQVLADLMRTKDVRRVYMQRELTHEEVQEHKRTLKQGARKQSEFLTAHGVWRYECRNRPTPQKPKEEHVFGEEVGVGADWSHLNRRRQRSRILSVVRDVRWLRKLEKARGEALQESPGEKVAEAAS